jgi:hypothetical protein
MSRRDQLSTDGYLEGDPLTGAREEEERLRELLGTLREDMRAPAGFRASVMRAVAEVPSSRWRRVADWWLKPRPVQITPAMGALAVAAVAAVLLWPGSDRSDVAGPAPDGASQVVTRFVLVAPEASSVRLTGDFLAWSREGIALEDLRGTGIWTADVPLPPGVYQYTFVIDETEWVADPRAVSQVDDGFGQMNSVVIVPAEGEA